MIEVILNSRNGLTSMTVNSPSKGVLLARAQALCLGKALIEAAERPREADGETNMIINVYDGDRYPNK